MASVKEHFSKGIGYIKYEMADLEQQKVEIQEFLDYHKGMTSVHALIAVSKRQADLDSINSDLYDLKQELAFYKDYFNYTQADIDNIPTPTKEQLEKDWQLILKEKDSDKWTEADSRALMERVKELDRSLGRI